MGLFQVLYNLFLEGGFMQNHLWAAIIAGGQGTRLFPISHTNRPKQFCRLDERNTFIQAVVENLTGIGVKSTHIVVITTSDNQTSLAKEQTLPRGVLSQNILQISPNYGYAGAMIWASEFINKLDPKAVVINTPADQYLVADEEFVTTMNNAIAAAKNGRPVIVGVKVNDLVTAMGCGHALFEESDLPCHSVIGFEEKPNREKADFIMRQGNSACNTGINVWQASTVLDIMHGATITGLATDELMRRLGNLKIAVGSFEWHDCGTLKSLYEISKKTPNHKNASLGNGTFERNNCRGSLLYASRGMELRVNGARDDAIVFTVIDEKPIIVVAKLAESQRIKDLADDFQRHRAIFSDDFSFGARNNIVLESNVSNELIVGFVGVKNYAVYVHKQPSGMLEAVVSQQLIH